jgi:hypothetical protein
MRDPADGVVGGISRTAERAAGSMSERIVESAAKTATPSVMRSTLEGNAERIVPRLW